MPPMEYQAPSALDHQGKQVWGAAARKWLEPKWLRMMMMTMMMMMMMMIMMIIIQ